MSLRAWPQKWPDQRHGLLPEIQTPYVFWKKICISPDKINRLLFCSAKKRVTVLSPLPCVWAYTFCPLFYTLSVAYPSTLFCSIPLCKHYRLHRHSKAAVAIDRTKTCSLRNSSCRKSANMTKLYPSLNFSKDDVIFLAEITDIIIQLCCMWLHTQIGSETFFLHH